MKDNDQKLAAFLERIYAIRDNLNEAELTEASLKKIATEMGLSEADWEKLQVEFEAHHRRGRSFLQYSNWDDAIGEFEQALPLNPNHPDTLYGLALAHGRRYWEQKNIEDKNKALSYADSCLGVAPDYEAAIQLVSNLKRSSQQRSIQSDKSRNMRSIMIMIFVISIFIIGLTGAIIFFVFTKTEQSVPQRNTNPSEAIEAVSPAASSNEITGSIKVEESSTSTVTNHELPEGIYTGQMLDGQRHGSGVMRYNNGDSYSGQWQNDQRHGSGVWRDKNREVIHAGKFEYDKPVRY